MTEPEYGTPEWHQHILDTLHDETGVRVSHDRIEFPGGHVFPVLRPKIHVNKNLHLITSNSDVASEHLYSRKFWVGQTNGNNKHHHFLDFFHNNVEISHNDVHYSTKYSNSPNLLHPEQFGPEVQKRLRTVHDPEISENERQELIEEHKERVQQHLNRNKKILFSGMGKNTNGKWKRTLYNPNTGELQSVHPDDWGNY
jgi:nucleoid DNA-binding protein